MCGVQAGDRPRGDRVAAPSCRLRRIARWPAIFLAVGALAGGATAQPRSPDSSPATSTINLTAPDIELGRLLSIVSERTGQRVMCDPRLWGVRLTILGAQGTAEELLDAVRSATGLQFRKVGNITYIARDAAGAAAVAHQYRRRNWPRLSAERAWLSLQASSRTRALAGRLGLGGTIAAQAGLTGEQAALLQRQGFLTVANLFPEYYQPMYDIFGALTDRRAERPASLPEFAGTKVFLRPNLQLILYLPVREAEAGQERVSSAGSLTWTIDLGSY